MDIDTLKSAVSTLSLEKIIPALIALVVGIVVAKLLCRLFDRILARSKIEKSLHAFLRSFFHILLYVLVTLITLGTLGVNVSSLVAVLSVVSLAISLAVQGTLSNIAGGIQLLTAHPFRVGDYVEIAGTEGNVTELGMIYTRLRMLDNKIVYLPNSDVASSKITNFTAEGIRRVDLSFSAAYRCPAEAVLAALLRAAQVEGCLTEPAAVAHVNAYEDSSISYILRAWCNAADYWPVYYAITENVRREFEKDNLEMSYPHLNVHLDTPCT